MNALKSCCIALGALMLAACATVQVPRPAGALDITPREVAARPDRHAASLVQWGGSILSVRNLANGSQLEVLAYPLDNAGRPRTDEPPSGRFIVVSHGFLDPLEYTSGRLLTASGRIHGVITAPVGEADYRYPRLDADSLFLWPKQRALPSVRPTIHLGIGSGGAWGGIGIGF